MAEYIGIEELHEQLIRVADGLELNTETLAKMFLYDCLLYTSPSPRD